MNRVNDTIELVLNASHNRNRDSKRDNHNFAWLTQFTKLTNKYNKHGENKHYYAKSVGIDRYVIILREITLENVALLKAEYLERDL